MPDSKLINLYQQMSELTEPECAKCTIHSKPFGCCTRIACEITLRHARDVWKVNLRHLFDENNDIPFLTKYNGCRIVPYMRPHCTLFTCFIAKFEHGPNPAWNKKYKELRDQIETIEWEEFDK